MKKIYRTMLSIALSFACIAQSGFECMVAQAIENVDVLYEDQNGAAAQAAGGITAAPATDPELGDCMQVTSADGYTCGGWTAHAFAKFDMSAMLVDTTKHYVLIGMDYKTDGDLSKLGVVVNGSRHLISEEAGAISGKYKKNVWNNIWVVYDMSNEGTYYGDSLVYINGVQCNGNGMLASNSLAKIKWNGRMTSLEMILADKTSSGQVETFIDNVRLYQADDIDTVLKVVNSSKYDVSAGESGNGSESGKTAYSGVLRVFRDRDANCVKKAAEAWNIESKTEKGIGEYKDVVSSAYATIASHRAHTAIDIDIKNIDFDSQYPYMLVGVNFKTSNMLERFVLTGNNNRTLISGYNTGYLGNPSYYSKTDWNKIWLVYDINSEGNYTNQYGDSMVYINGSQKFTVGANADGFIPSGRGASGGIKDISSIGILFANKASADTTETTEIAVDDIRIYMADSLDTAKKVAADTWEEPATEVTDVQIDGKLRSENGRYIVGRDSVQLRVQYDELIDAESFDKTQVFLNGQNIEDVTVSGKNVCVNLNNLAGGKSYTLSLKNIGKDVCGAQLAEKEIKFKTVGDIDVEKMAIYKDFSVMDTLESGALTPRIIGVSNNTTEEKSVTAFSVLMKSGMIESIASKAMIIPANGKVDVGSFEVNVPDNTEDQYVLKMFVWDSISNGIGYMKHIELK